MLNPSEYGTYCGNVIALLDFEASMTIHHSPYRYRPAFDRFEDRCLLAAPIASPTLNAFLGLNQVHVHGPAPTVALIEGGTGTQPIADLARFCADHNLPLGNVAVVNVPGQAATLIDPQGWGVEEALDMDVVKEINPQANILVVCAQSASLTDMLGAIDYASSLKQVSVVSMSFGTSVELPPGLFDPHFVSNHVAYVAASGDSGFGIGSPASSPFVVSAGGTDVLTYNSKGTRLGEHAWNGSGGGESIFEAVPSYQLGLPGVNLFSGRAGPDVSALAGPSPGYSVYDTDINGYRKVWGTSGACPLWAGIISLADQYRAAHRQSNLTTYDALNALYREQLHPTLPQRPLHDITKGNNGMPAGKGFDEVTGLGSPNGPYLMRTLFNARAVKTPKPSVAQGIPPVTEQPLTVKPLFHLSKE